MLSLRGIQYSFFATVQKAVIQHTVVDILTSGQAILELIVRTAGGGVEILDVGRRSLFAPIFVSIKVLLRRRNGLLLLTGDGQLLVQLHLTTSELGGEFVVSHTGNERHGGQWRLERSLGRSDCERPRGRWQSSGLLGGGAAAAACSPHTLTLTTTPRPKQ